MANDQFVSRRKFVSMAAAAMGATLLAGCSGAVAASSSSSASTSASSAASAASSASAEASSGASAGASGKTLVVYFSQTGHTAAIASAVVAHLQADEFRLHAAEPYVEADLNYNDSSTRATVEQNTPDARPGIAALPENLGDYDTVLVGYPIWWGKVPRLMCTFAEGCDLSGKTLIPFCTSGSSDIGSSADEMAALASPDATWLPGRRFAIGTEAEVVAGWVDGLGI